MKRNCCFNQISRNQNENEYKQFGSNLYLLFIYYNINVIGRNTQGVRIINLGKEDRVVDIACVASEE